MPASLDLETICKELFGDRYHIGPDGKDKIVINCTIPEDTLKHIVPARVNLSTDAALVCGLKTCNIPGTLLVIYPGTVEGTYSYFLINIQVIPDNATKKLMRKLYIVWAQKYKPSVEFNLEALRQ